MILALDELRAAGIDLQNQHPIQVWGDVRIESPAFCAAALRWDTFIRIGAFCNINAGTEIGHTAIGRYTSIAQKCFIGADRHPVDWVSTSRILYVPDFRGFGSFLGQSAFQHRPFQGTGEPVRIGNDVLIANSCIINRGVTIGDGAIVAPGSVVTRDVPPYAIVGGSPAKVIKMRFPERIIERLLRAKWWDYSIFELPSTHIHDPEAFLDDLDERRATLQPYVPKFILDNVSAQTFLRT